MNQITIPSEAIANGKCGENSIWYIISDTMYIKGFGMISENLFDVVNSFSVHNVIIEQGITQIGMSIFSLWNDRRYRLERQEYLPVNISIEHVSIPTTVHSIGSYAFMGCVGLESIDLLQGVKEIGDAAFEDCASLSSILLPEGLENIGYNAFKNCRSLVSMVIPDSVINIEGGAFCFCESLSMAVLPSNISYIEGSLFEGCTRLRAVELPPRVKEIGFDAFCDCHSLREVCIPQSVTYIEETAFKNCCGLETLIIPENVSVIEKDAFMGCSGIVFLKLCSSHLSRDAGVFSRLGGLKSVELPDGITEIMDCMFCDCINLETIRIPDSMTLIGKYAFCGCTNLKEIHLPPKLETIEENAFAYCTSLKELTICSDEVDIKESAFFGCSSLQAVHMGDSVKKIGDAAFCLCTDLRSVIIESNPVEIGKYAFWGCRNLSSVHLSSSDVKIGIFAFDHFCRITPEDKHCRIGTRVPDPNYKYIRPELFLEEKIRDNNRILWFDYTNKSQLIDDVIWWPDSQDLFLRSTVPEIGKTYVIAGDAWDGEIFSVLFFPDQKQTCWKLLEADRMPECTVIWAKVILEGPERFDFDYPACFNESRTLKKVQIINSIKLEELLHFPACKVDFPLLEFHGDSRCVMITENSRWQVHHWADYEFHAHIVVYIDKNKKKHMVLYTGALLNGIENYSIGNIIDDYS